MSEEADPQQNGAAEEQAEQPQDAQPMSNIIIRVKDGKAIQTTERPAPNSFIQFSFAGEDVQTEPVEGATEPAFNVEKEFNLPSNEETVGQLLTNPLKIKLMDRTPAGKATEDVERGVVTINWADLIFWKDREEEDEYAEVVAQRGYTDVAGMEGAQLNVEIIVPERIIPKEELANINVLTIRLCSIHNVPKSWAVGDGDASKIAETFVQTAEFSLPSNGEQEEGLKVEGGTPIAASAPVESEGEEGAQQDADGTEEAPKESGDDSSEQQDTGPKEGTDERVEFGESGIVSRFLPAPVCEKFKAMAAAKPWPIKVSRSLKSGTLWPYTRRYTADANVSLSAILAPGSSDAEIRAEFEVPPEAREGLNEEEQAAIDALGDKKAKKPAEFEPEEDLEEGSEHPYEVAKTYIRVQFSFIQPLVPRPVSPPPPLPKVSEIVPPKVVEKKKEAVRGTEKFTSEIRKIVDELAEEFGRMFVATQQSNTLNAEGSEERKQSLIFHLNTSGKYFNFKERLKTAATTIIRERFHRSKGMTEAEQQQQFTEVYAYLARLLNQTLNSKFTPDAPAPLDPTKQDEQIKLCRHLAEEAEMVANNEKALVQRKQACVVHADDPELWYEYGALCMRVCDLPKAEECFREALALKPDHLEALLAFGVLLVIREKMTHAQSFFEEATQRAPESFLAWALQGLFYEMEGKEGPRRNAFKQVLQLEKQEGESKRSPYLRSAAFLISLNAVQMLERSLSEEISRNGNSAEVLLLLAEGYIPVDVNRSLQYLNDLLDNLDKRNGKGLCLYGHCLFLQGKAKESITYYEKALGLRNPYVHVTMLYRLGMQYLQVSKYYEAGDAFSKACQLHPSASTWLGLGRAHYARADYNQAEEALAEANIMDAHNGEVWGWLALTALRQNKIPEADQAFKEAIKNDLEILQLFRDIGRQYLRLGQLPVAEQSIRRAIALGNDPALHRLLGDVMNERGHKEEAIDLYKKGIAELPDGEDKKHCAKQCVAVLRQLNRIDEAAKLQQDFTASQQK